MIGGFFGYIIPKALTGLGAPFSEIFINFLDPFFIGLYISLIFAVIGSKKYPAKEEEIAYRANLLVLPESEKVVADYRRDKVYGYILIVAGIGVSAFLLFGWALPYNGFI